MTEPDDGTRVPDDADTNGGTQDDAARNAETEANKGRLIASLQESVAAERARAAAAEAQIAALTRPASTPAASGNGDDSREQRIAEAREWAEGRRDPKGNKDPVAGVVLDVLDELRMTQSELANLRKLDRIPDDAKRDKVQKHFNENRHRLGDIDAAQAEIDAKELAEANRLKDEQIAKLTKAMQQAAGARDPNVVRTSDREVTASELTARETTKEDWDARQRALEEAGNNGDQEAHNQRMREQRERRAGKIIVK